MELQLNIDEIIDLLKEGKVLKETEGKDHCVYMRIIKELPEHSGKILLTEHFNGKETSYIADFDIFEKELREQNPENEMHTFSVFARENWVIEFLQ